MSRITVTGPVTFQVPAGWQQSVPFQVMSSATTTVMNWNSQYILSQYGSMEAVSDQGITWRARPLTEEELLA